MKVDGAFLCMDSAAPVPRTRSAQGTFAKTGTLDPKTVRKAYAPRIRPKVTRGPADNLLNETPLMFEGKRDVLEFHSDFVADKVDTVNAVIRGVSVITGGVIARGHDLSVDDITLQQMHNCATQKIQVPVKVDHKSGAAAICGYLENFQIVGDKLKADWHLLKSHPQKDQILEVAERMPRGVGLSASFVAPLKKERGKNGKDAARCEELLSVDYVTQPAANPDGMFEAKVDSPENSMPTTNKTVADQPTLADVLAAVQSLSTLVSAHAEKISAQEKTINLLTNPPSLEDVAKMDEAELAELGLTAEDVQAALEQVAAQQGQTDDGIPADGPVADGELVGAPGAAGAPAAAPASTGFNALSKRIVELSSELVALKKGVKKDREEVQFAEINKKVDALIAENEALRAAQTLGAQPAAPGVDRNGVKFFSANKDEGEFENLVQFHIEEKKVSKGKAMEFARKENPAAYENYLVRLGVKHA